MSPPPLGYQLAGLDQNRDGKVTKAEAVAAVRTKLKQGERHRA